MSSVFKKKKNKLARRRTLTCSLAQLKDSGTGGGVCVRVLSLLIQGTVRHGFTLETVGPSVDPGVWPLAPPTTDLDNLTAAHIY